MQNKKSFIVFTVVILIILFMANLVVYEAFLLALGVYQNNWLLILAMALLGVSFIASTLVGMRYYNVLSRFYYRISMLWMGFFAYFCIASGLYVLEDAYIGDLNHIFAIFIFGISVLGGLYGLTHAKNVIVKTVKVSIPNWKGKKAVWISDLHIGQVNGNNFVQKVVDQIKEISPNIVFIGGDLFDGSSLSGILESINPLRDLKTVPLGVYFVMGNHESYGRKDLFEKKIKEVGIQVLNDEMRMVNGAQIVGVDYDSTAKKTDFENVLSKINIDKNLPSILLKHEPSNVDVAEQAGITLQISGHTHKAQQWPFEYLAWLSYRKFTYGLNSVGNIQVYTSSGTGTWGIPMRVGTDSEIVVFEF